MGRAASADAVQRRLAEYCSRSRSERRFTHVRLKIYPDGGVARLRIHGEVVPDAMHISRWRDRSGRGRKWRPRAVAAGDQFFGAPRNLLMPCRVKNMGDGWETRRRRGPGPRLGDSEAGSAGDDRARRSGHGPFQRKLPGQLFAEARLRPAQAESSSRRRSLERTVAPNEASANHRHFFKTERRGKGNACALQYLSRRRREPVALVGRCAAEAAPPRWFERTNQSRSAEAR